MNYLSPCFFEVSPMQGVNYRAKNNKCLQILNNKKNELKVRDTYLKILFFTPYKDLKCLHIHVFRDIWRHFRDTYSPYSLAWCLQMYGQNHFLETLSVETLSIKPLYTCLYGCFPLLLSVSNWRHLSLRSVSKCLQLKSIGVSEMSLTVSHEEVITCQF